MSIEDSSAKVSNLSLLNETILYAGTNSIFYKRHLEGFFKKAYPIKNIEDYKQIPFTTKDMLSEHNEEFVCVPKEEFAECTITSGSTGKPVSVFLTKEDLERLAQNESQSFVLAGCTNGDIFQISTTMDRLFMAGLAYYLGIQKLGATSIRVGIGAVEQHLDSILRFNPTKLIAVPSFVVRLIEMAKDRGIDLNKTSVDTIICIGEPIRGEAFELNALGNRIREDWWVELRSTYASTEMQTAFTECQVGRGLHLNEELLFLEVLDDNGQVAGEGEAGEIVVTTLGIKGMPMIRYKTGDIAKIYYSPCPCGRNSPRISSIIGRKGQMIKYKGTTLYPNALFNVLDDHVGIAIYQIEVSQDELGNHDVAVLLESTIDERLEESLVEAFKSKIRVAPKIKKIDKAALRSMVFPTEKRKPEKIRFA